METRTPHFAPQLLLASLLCAVPANAQQPAEPPQPPAAETNTPALPEPGPQDGSPRRITSVAVEYLRPNDGHPTEAALLEAVVRLTPTAEGYVAPRPEGPFVEITLAEIPSLENPVFYDSALPLFAPAVVRRLQDLGLIGVYVEPDREQF
ncbi:MAG: hypothetical protein VYC34_01165, partial [Planctomycetota bacterium]|nr:hypothetical protein [Planctomycetota bacterium]